MNKHKAIIILDFLLRGNGIVKNKSTYLLSDEKELCVIGESYDFRTCKKKEILLKVDLGIALSNFILWCNTFTDDEIAIIISNSTLAEGRRLWK